MDTCFFRAAGAEAGSDGTDPAGYQERFEATPACTGPWSPQAMHGGPPSALLVRACELAARQSGGRAGTADGLVALRAGIDFLAPVPVGPVAVRARVVRPGRLVTLAEATLTAGGRDVLHARTWLVRALAPTPAGTGPGEAGPPVVGTGEPRATGPLECPASMTGWDFGYARAVEWRLLSGDPDGPGPAAVWGRQRVPLVDGEQPSGLQRAVLVADSGNGVSAGLDWDRWSFVNVDLAVHLARPLSGEWVLLDARTRIEATGTGLATSVLHDEAGVVGEGAQILVITPRAAAT